MSETFRELTPEEVKLATIQFMGQHLTGDLKVLDRHLVAKNRTCQGMTINPTEIVNSIGPSNPMHTVVNAGINVNSHVHQAPIQQPLPVTITETPVISTPSLGNDSQFKELINCINRIEEKLDNIIELFKK